MLRLRLIWILFFACSGCVIRGWYQSTIVGSVGSGIVLSGQPGIREVREEYRKWLTGVFGSSEELMLGTYTFRNLDLVNYKPGLQRVTRAGRKLVELLGSIGTSAFVVVEEGTDTRRLHLHSLSNLELRSQKVVHEWWRRMYGHQKLDVVHSRGGVSDYVTKYVTKSDMPFWASGPLFRSVRQEVSILRP